MSVVPFQVSTCFNCFSHVSAGSQKKFTLFTEKNIVEACCGACSLSSAAWLATAHQQAWCILVLCHSDHSGCELKLIRSGIEKVLVTSRDHFLQYSVQCPIEQKAPHSSIPPFRICSGNLLNGLTHHKAPQFYGLSASVRTHHSDT